MTKKRAEERMAFALTLAATAWFALAAVWEIGGPILAGHYATNASLGIIADNMLRWDIVGPVWEYTETRPAPAQYYCHHPWGIFWTTAAFVEVFGRHDLVCRLPAVLLSIATPPLLYLLGRALWRPLAGAVAAAAFTVLPITLSFAQLNALEVPVIAYTTLGLWGYVRHRQETGRNRRGRAHLIASLCGFGLALHADWPAYVLVGSLLLFDLGGIVMNETGRKRLLVWWLLTAGLALATGSLYLWLFHESGKIDDLFSSAAHRAATRDRSLGEIIAARHYWLELSFTPIAIGLGAMGAVLSVVRARRRPQEAVVLFVLLMAAVQYLAFPQGADVHVFWPHYFGQFFALAMGSATAACFGPAPSIATRRLSFVFAGALAVLGAIARDGVEVLHYARATGGRFNEKGLFIESDGAKVAFLRWLAPQIEAPLALHASTKPSWAHTFSLARPVALGLPIAPNTGQVVIADARFLTDQEQAEMARGGLIAAGPHWAAMPRRSRVEAFRFREREPSPFEWSFVSATEPRRQIEADPFASWELAIHFDLPAEPPELSVGGVEETRIAHNAAVHRELDASPFFRALSSELEPPSAIFGDGTELVGVRFEPGVRPLLTLYFRAAGPSAFRPDVRSIVEEAPLLSSTMKDPTVRDVAAPPLIKPARWRRGFVYPLAIEIRKRPGTERFELTAPGHAPVTVLRLPR